MKKIIILMLVLLAGSVNGLQPVFYGTVLDAAAIKDGSLVTAYPQSDPADFVTDIVGASGLSGLSSYYKVNLNNLHAELDDGEIVVIVVDDGSVETTRLVPVDLSLGAQRADLNFDISYQDYDGDGYFADSDCNDYDTGIHPGAEDICGDGIDQDCKGGDNACSSSRRRGGGSSSSTYVPPAQELELEGGEEPAEGEAGDTTPVTPSDGGTQPVEGLEVSAQEDGGLEGVTGRVIDTGTGFKPANVLVVVLLAGLLFLFIWRRKNK